MKAISMCSSLLPNAFYNLQKHGGESLDVGSKYSGILERFLPVMGVLSRCLTEKFKILLDNLLCAEGKRDLFRFK